MKKGWWKVPTTNIYIYYLLRNVWKVPCRMGFNHSTVLFKQNQGNKIVKNWIVSGDNYSLVSANTRIKFFWQNSILSKGFSMGANILTWKEIGLNSFQITIWSRQKCAWVAFSNFIPSLCWCMKCFNSIKYQIGIEESLYDECRWWWKIWRYRILKGLLYCSANLLFCVLMYRVCVFACACSWVIKCTTNIDISPFQNHTV